MKNEKKPKLPSLLKSKIYKTGQTRGADDDQIYQNRVGRNSTALIPGNFFNPKFILQNDEKEFEKGFIVLISPNDYFSTGFKERMPELGLTLGVNALVFYETREQWNQNSPGPLGWSPATSRTAPLGGEYVARIPATTATSDSTKISLGFNTTSLKGAGIRCYEYSSSANTNLCKLQLELLYWLSFNSIQVSIENGMSETDATIRKEQIIRQCTENRLLDYVRLQEARIIDKDHNTICPLCLEKIDANGFYDKVQQAEGREVVDLTITQINLFHIQELRVGKYNHKVYNLGWGHHHCNVVVKDAGINETIEWLKKIITKNNEYQAMLSNKSS